MENVRQEAIEEAARVCDHFVEAYSFWEPFPEGYVYNDAESRAAVLFAKGRLEVVAKLIRALQAAEPKHQPTRPEFSLQDEPVLYRRT
jgi:hypothetical protein